MKTCCLFNKYFHGFFLIGFLTVGGPLSFLGFFPLEMADAQVGRCTTLMQSYITCNNVRGRNSTVPDIGKRFGGSSNQDLIFSESILGAPSIQPFQFSPPRDASIVGLPDLSLTGPSRQTPMEVFSGMTPSIALQPFKPRIFEQTQRETSWARP